MNTANPATGQDSIARTGLPIARNTTSGESREAALLLELAEAKARDAKIATVLEKVDGVTEEEVRGVVEFNERQDAIEAGMVELEELKAARLSRRSIRPVYVPLARYVVRTRHGREMEIDGKPHLMKGDTIETQFGSMAVVRTLVA